MLNCLYDVRMGGGGCTEERTLDYDFCNGHMNTPRGRQHAMDVIASGGLTRPSQVEEAIKQAQEIPDVDYQTTALERMAEALDLILGWVDEARGNLDSLGGSSQWRYKDRGGTEQQHTFLGVYERALDRMSRHLSAMSKVALQEKIVTLGKGQVDMMIRLLMGLITELQLPPSESDRARYILLNRLSEEANLTPQVERHAKKELDQPRVVDGSLTGGVTGVSVRGEKVT